MLVTDLPLLLSIGLFIGQYMSDVSSREYDQDVSPLLSGRFGKIGHRFENITTYMPIGPLP